MIFLLFKDIPPYVPTNMNGIHKEELCIGHIMTLMDTMKMDD